MHSFLFALVLALGFAACAQAQEPASARVPLLSLAADTRLAPDATAVLGKIVSEARIAASADPEDEERELRSVLRSAREALATEGWFQPQLKVQANPAAPPLYALEIELGPRTLVGSVDLKFDGAITGPQYADQRRQFEAAWALPVGRPFQSDAWGAAKTRLLTAVAARDFAGARITASRAEIDAAEHSARLEVEINSGPTYTLGPLKIEGLKRYPPSVVERYNPIEPGAAYSRSELAAFQQQLQDTPYFSSVVVTPQLDPEHPLLAPLLVEVSEAHSKRFSTGIGYGTNTGAHIELAYRQALVFDRPWPLQTGLRIDQTGGYAYADIFLPPRSGEWRDSVGVLADISDIENLKVRRAGFGASTTRLSGTRDARNREITFSVNVEREQRQTPQAEPIVNNVLSGSATWISRNLDSLANPRRGRLLELEASAGLRQLAFDQGFVRGYARGLQFIPLSASNVLILRGELGSVLARSADNVPNKFLFRTGGATSVRGYDYQSLGVEQDGAVVGGRALAVASVEVVHWISDWGIAGFVDAGDAADTFADLKPALGVGAGARLRTPAGPLAIDLAWGERLRQWRLQFAVTLAF
ncbi:MAG: BamA/TamA family outer membrane protein [Burkholderiaceae bacterium]